MIAKYTSAIFIELCKQNTNKCKYVFVVIYFVTLIGFQILVWASFCVWNIHAAALDAGW